MATKVKRKTVKKKPTTRIKVKRKLAKKTTTRNTTAKRTTTQKTKSSASTPKISAKSIKVGNKVLTKSQLATTIAELTGLKKSEVNTVLFEALPAVMQASLQASVKQFTFPGLLKAVVKIKPATKARKGINPFNGEPTIFKAKPKRQTVKIQPLKGLKDMVDKKASK